MQAVHQPGVARHDPADVIRLRAGVEQPDAHVHSGLARADDHEVLRGRIASKRHSPMLSSSLFALTRQRLGPDAQVGRQQVLGHQVYLRAELPTHRFVARLCVHEQE